jgi:hypothetical protein
VSDDFKYTGKLPERLRMPEGEIPPESAWFRGGLAERVIGFWGFY